MGGVSLVLLLALIAGGLISSTMVELRKRKNKRDSDDKSLPSKSSSSHESDDASEANTRSKRKRKREDVESSNTTNSRKSSAESGPHVCRFCGQEFRLSQALGGHMNRHRSEKEHEELQKAETLVAQKQQYIVGNPHWNVQGGGGGNPYYAYVGTSSRGQYFLPNQPPATLQTSPLPPNQGFATPQQNAHINMTILPQQGGAYFNPMDNTRPYYGVPPQRNTIPTKQFPALYTPVNNSGQHLVQTGYSDPKLVLHSGTDIAQSHHGQNIFHSNQGGTPSTSQTQHLEDFSIQSNMISSNQQAQSNISMASESYIIRKSVEQRQISTCNVTQFVDQHGNPVQDNQPGHAISFQMPEEYTQLSLNHKLAGTSASGLRSETHDRVLEQEEVFQMAELDMSHDFQGGVDHSIVLMDSGQDDFEANASIGSPT